MKKLYILIPLVFLAGCKSVGPNYERPVTELPASYQIYNNLHNAQTAVSATWWQVFADPTLDSLIAKAVENNLDVRQALARVDQADAYAKQAGASLFPTVDLTGGASRSKSILGPNAFLLNMYKLGFSSNFEIDFWGKYRRMRESVRAQALASRYAKDSVDLTLKSAVASQYFTLRSYDAQINLLNQILKTQAETLDLTQRRLKGGVASGLDVYQAESNRENNLALLAQMRLQRGLAENQLQVLTGDLNLKVDAISGTTLPIAPIPPAGLPSQLLENRPDVRQAEETLKAANANIGVAKAALYPSISLTGSLGLQSLELGKLFNSSARVWSIGSALSLPIFNNGQLKAQVAQVTAQQQESLFAYQSTLQNAFKGVSDALVTLSESKQREEALANTRLAARKALTIANNRYKAGYSGYLDALDAQRTSDDASIAFLQSRQAQLLAAVELYRVLGGGWQPSAVEKQLAEQNTKKAQKDSLFD